MAETDNWASSSWRMFGETRPAPVHDLLSLERAQKLDLLLHLLANLQQSLVLCGPLGIGKSTLLQAFIHRKPDHWTCCMIEGDARLSFETFQRQVLDQCQAANLHDLLTDYARSARKLIVAIEEAGELVPGLITILCQFAETYPALRLIFVLTPDALHIKLRSDHVLEQCHFIELPALTKQQCETFLQNLSARRDAPISYRAISSAIVEEIYRDSHGIPGRIITALQRLNDGGPQFFVKHRWTWGIAGVASMLMAGFGIYALWYDDEVELPAPDTLRTPAAQTTVKSARPPLAVPENEHPSPFARVPSPPITLPQRKIPMSAVPMSRDEQNAEPTPPPLGEPANLSEVPSAVTINPTPAPAPFTAISTSTHQAITEPLAFLPAPANPAPVMEDTTPSDVSDATIAENPPESVTNTSSNTVKTRQTPAAPPQTSSAATSTKDVPVAENRSFGHSPSAGNAWVVAQPKQHYTLQLLVASQRQGAEQAIRQLGGLPHPVYFVMRQRQGKVDYVVLYGSFATPREAEAAQSALPARWRQAWLRKLEAVQQEILGHR